MTWASALGWRLRRHFLEHEPAPTVEAVVDRLVAVPAWSGDARTAIRLRLAAAGPGDVDAAVADGRIFATYAFRGATQYMTPSTAAVHLALRCAGRQWELPSWREHYGVEPQDWPRLRATVRDALRGGPLTQGELAAAVARDPRYRHLRAAFEDRSHTFLKPFAWQGDLCFAPSAGGPAFRLLEGIPGWTGPAALDEAGPRAVRAYLAAYGPATPDRIQYWLGGGLSAGRKRITAWIGQLGDDLATLTVDGEPALCRAEDAPDIARAEESREVVLLPGADQWVLGPGTSDEHIVPAAHRALATRGANLVLTGGRLTGTWKIERGTIRVERLPGAPPLSAQAAAGRLSAALGRDLRLAAG